MTINFPFIKFSVFGLLPVIPFVVMELVNRSVFFYDFPFPLFLILWLLAVLFFILINNIYLDCRIKKGKNPETCC